MAKRLGFNTKRVTRMRVLHRPARCPNTRECERTICTPAGVSGVGRGPGELSEPAPGLSTRENYRKHTGADAPNPRHRRRHAAVLPADHTSETGAS